VKTLLKDQKKNWYLQPANEIYEDIYPTEWLMIYGVVVGSFRSYL
jgi:SOS-response transcriptional repressor LexA